MTMFVMTLGEMNYADTFMPWKDLPHPTLTNILFLLFALGMPIILMNMLVREPMTGCVNCKCPGFQESRITLP